MEYIHEIHGRSATHVPGAKMTERHGEIDTIFFSDFYRPYGESREAVILIDEYFDHN